MDKPRTTTKQDLDLLREKNQRDYELRKFNEAWPKLTYWQKKEILYRIALHITAKKIEHYIRSIPLRWFVAVYSHNRLQLNSICKQGTWEFYLKGKWTNGRSHTC